MSTTVVRTTTDKLEAVITEQAAEDRRLQSSQFVGGRDWVLFFEQMVMLEAAEIQASSTADLLTDLAAQLVSLANRPKVPPLADLTFAGSRLDPHLLDGLVDAANDIGANGFKNVLGNPQRIGLLLNGAYLALGFYTGVIDNNAPWWAEVRPERPPH
jgi:hypothetical protein